MAFAASAVVIQVLTLIYCVHVYIKSLLDRSPITDTSSGLPSYSGSVRTLTARQAWKRTGRIIHLQWRGIAVVITIIINVVFFAIVFISMDNSAKPTPENLKKGQPWILCLVLSEGDKTKCAAEASSLGPSETAVMAVLVLLSVLPTCPLIIN
jgi:hypothetical protein